MMTFEDFRAKNKLSLKFNRTLIFLQEIFIQHGVTLKKASACYISALNTIGVLSFSKYQKGNVHFFEWKVTEMCEIMDTDSQDSDWSLVNTSTVTPDKPSDDNSNSENDSNKNSKITLRVLFRDLRGIEYGKNELRLYNQDFTIHSLYLFNHGSPHSFVDFLERKRFVQRSARRKQFYYCMEEVDNDKLQKSFSELNIEDIRNRPRATNAYMGFMSRLANVHQILPLSKQSEESRTRIIPQQEDGANSNETKPSEESIEAECKKLAPRPDVHRGGPLDAKMWTEFRAANGSITDPDRVKQIIFRGVSLHVFRSHK